MSIYCRGTELNADELDELGEGDHYINILFTNTETFNHMDPLETFDIIENVNDFESTIDELIDKINKAKVRYTLLYKNGLECAIRIDEDEFDDIADVVRRFKE